jgi:LmbE family N-acetylglucosaminyl deacetylase
MFCTKGAVSMPDSKEPPIQRVLVVTAHPDDAEFGAGGTVAKLVREGKQVTYCIVTNGNKGSGDRSMTPERLAGIRAEEQRNAARVLGVETVEFLGFPDCEVEDTRESRMAVTASIRRHRPDRLIIQNPLRTKNLGASHRDHRTVAGIALDCVYPLARDHMAFPELLAQGLEPHKVREVYLMWWENPEVVVDISETMDLKVKALACHASQFRDFAAVEKRVRERSAELGKPKGYAYAETFDVIRLDR